PAVARRPGAGAAARPDPGQRALLADAGLVLEPDLDRLAAGVLGRRRRDQRGEAFLKASCAASSALGCFGRTDRRVKPSRRRTLPTERSCRRTAERASISARRSTRRQRTTEPALGRPKADPGVPVGVRPPLHGGRQLRFLLGRETRPAPRPGPVAPAREALRVVAVHPVA